ncbi:JAB domain-containing protein [Pantoea sp. At-9b]|uniref:JAB domain-containing protein n=1 Tax=Pantoea sp. (strain At-9b) TaxID=592316 RepID=UPI0001B400EE
MATESQILEEAARAIDHRYATGTFFASPEMSGVFFRVKLVGRSREIFAVAFLNNQHQLFAYEEMFQGIISSVGIPPDVVYRTLQLNAAVVTVTHNAENSHEARELAGRKLVPRSGEPGWCGEWLKTLTALHSRLISSRLTPP